jgi:DNA-binding NtrC family response regulator
MVKQSNGYINVYGSIDHGLLFEIYLPRIDEVYDHQREGSEEIELEHGTETILLVDDEDGVRGIVYTILSDSGYSVLQAGNVEEALFISERQEERPIKLLVTDIVMPGMSGYELAEKIVSSNPDMKVLYMSGYTDEAVVHHGMMAEGVQFIQKPFTPIDLAHKVREVLDKEC